MKKTVTATQNLQSLIATKIHQDYFEGCSDNTATFRKIVLAAFTARRYASAVYATALCLSVRLYVRLSVTSRSFIKTDKHRITQITPHDSAGNLVFWCQRSLRNWTGVNSYGGAKFRWGWTVYNTSLPSSKQTASDCLV